MRVKVIANKPLHGQDSIDDLIGKEYTVEFYDDDDDSVSVIDDVRGMISLNKSEYIILEG